LLEPIPFGAGAVYEQAGWRYRVVEEADELVLQRAGEHGWIDLYGFVPQPAPMVDLVTSNWFTSTHPHSPFVSGLMISTQRADGTRIALSDWGELALTEQTPDSTAVTPLAREAIPDLLETRFGLPGFALGDAGRVVRAAQAGAGEPASSSRSIAAR
jgi:N-hydroxyarylamine O-acetyltransferase